MDDIFDPTIKYAGHAGGKALWALNNIYDNVYFKWYSLSEFKKLKIKYKKIIRGSARAIEKKLIRNLSDWVKKETNEKKIYPFGNMQS